MYCRGWSEAKPGQAGDQNQDAFATRLVADAAAGGGGDSGALLAICDGATSTVYAGPWARALAAAAEPDWPGLDDAALTLRLDAVRERFQLTLPDDLPWPMAHKIAREGSQATLVVAAFTRAPDSDEISVRTVAVGDSSLILFRRDGSAATFPLEKSADYGLNPRLVSTKSQPGLPYERWDAVLAPGDVLIGCTDAVAKWTLQGLESADRSAVFRLLVDVLGDGAGADPGEPPAAIGLFDRIASSAAPRRLDEDDVTLVLCVPLRKESTGAPLDFAREVLTSHLTGDLELPAAPGRRAEPEPPAAPVRPAEPERPAEPVRPAAFERPPGREQPPASRPARPAPLSAIRQALRAARDEIFRRR
jgi:hypothetical protein